MNIGFDLDGIFINTPPLIPRTIIERLYKDKSSGIPHYRIPGKLEQKIRQLSHVPALREPLHYNLKFLNELTQEKEHTLFLISSRFGFLKKQTESLAKKYGLYTIFKKMYFNFENKQPHIFKNDVLNGLHLDRYVDDDLSLLKFLGKHQPKTHFYWLNPKLTQEITKNIKAIRDIREILT